MIVSVQIADVGPTATLGALRKPPSARGVKGLLHGNVAFAAQLTRGMATPSPGRCGLVAFWEDDTALDRFLAEDPLAHRLAAGWRVRLRPLRASGSWPGLPPETRTTRVTDGEGPVVALTLGRLRLSQTFRFLRANARTGASVLRAAGLLWATGLGAPPFVSTFSIWRDARALMSYAYGHGDPAHADVIAEANAKPFHHQSAFIRFQPYAVAGQLTGKNPLPADLLTTPASLGHDADRERGDDSRARAARST